MENIVQKPVMVPSPAVHQKVRAVVQTPVAIQPIVQNITIPVVQYKTVPIYSQIQYSVASMPNVYGLGNQYMQQELG